MSKETQIYLVDDDTDFREATCEVLESADYSVATFSRGEDMLAKLDPEWPGTILCDVRMAGMDGFAVLKAVRAIATDIPLVMITGHGDVRLAIAAIKAGAYDFLEKPAQPEFLLGTMSRTLNARKLVLENRRLRSGQNTRSGLAGVLVGRSRVMRELRAMLLRLAPLPMTVLISGETGTGKSIVAKALHAYGDGAGSFETISCATASAEDLGAALAGIPDDVSTLYLRSVHRLDTACQAILADYLRTPGTPRIVASMTGSAGDAPDAALSDELYFLANVARIDLPPLRERGKDVYQLLEVFLRAAAQRFKRPLPEITDEMIREIAAHDWPGNARELQGVAERLVIGLPINLTARGGASSSPTLGYDDAMHRFERDLLMQALRETEGRKGEAADLLAIPRKRLYLRMKAVGLLDTGRD
ncbi:sigma-54-dependent transcriptional regulator [Oceanibium sediminis]|uniref:sigma-54-dependent transcriptional regulator n=1 Tax=Oceanibium sediminis TaxID=2026339 RepID=UPI000DD47255|nr:sigma-54 dependent transcriptional regulator [Oceanibium sediminis]